MQPGTAFSLNSLIEKAVFQTEYAINLTNISGELLMVNRAYLQLYKFDSEAEIIGKKQNIIKSPQTSATVYRNMWETIMSGAVWKGELTNRAHDGSDVFIHLTISPVIEDGQIIAFMGLSLDRRQQIILERQLFQANKLVLLHELGTGLAHELNNPLTSLLLETDYLTEEMGNASSEQRESHMRQAVANIQSGVKRIKKMTGQLLEYSNSNNSHDLEIVGIAEVIQDSRLLLDGRLDSAKISVETTVDSALEVCASRVHLRSVFQGLFTNSLDAFLGSSVEEKRIRISAKALDNGCLEIHFQDNAGGMPEAVALQVFDPFFTTRKDRNHSGLGLTLARKIIGDHGGKITALSSDGWTTMHIDLPQSVSHKP